VIGKLVSKLLGIGLVLAGVYLVPGAWMLLADPPHGPGGLAFLIGLFATGFVGSLIVIGGRLIVPPRPKAESMVKEKQVSGFDEFF
jgi:hypothetical protein